VVSPNGRKDVNYFTTVLADAVPPSTLQPGEYGLPLSRLTTDSGGRGISVKYNCTTTRFSGGPRYVGYYHDPQQPLPTPFTGPVLTSERMVYEDGRDVTTDHSDNDGYG